MPEFNRQRTATVPRHRSIGERGLRILRAAVNRFTRDGAAAFTARGVAKEAGVSLGSVQHIFPSKQKLLKAMLEFKLTEYEAVFQQVLECEVSAKAFGLSLSLTKLMLVFLAAYFQSFQGYFGPDAATGE